jgi:hypothetical protein
MKTLTAREVLVVPIKQKARTTKVYSTHEQSRRERTARTDSATRGKLAVVRMMEAESDDVPDDLGRKELPRRFHLFLPWNKTFRNGPLASCHVFQIQHHQSTEFPPMYG